MNQDKPGWGAMALVAVLHLLCCGIPLLILSGVSLGFVFPQWPVVAVVLAVVGVAGFLWYLKRGCATCHRNEGRCRLERGATPAQPTENRKGGPAGME